jgi:hypothetical protein
MSFLKFGVPPSIKDPSEEESLQAKPQIDLDPQVAQLLLKAHQTLSSIKLNNPEHWQQERDEFIRELRIYLGSSAIGYLEASGYLDPSISTDDTASALKEVFLKKDEAFSNLVREAAKESNSNFLKKITNFIKSIFKR